MIPLKFGHVMSMHLPVLILICGLAAWVPPALANKELLVQIDSIADNDTGVRNYESVAESNKGDAHNGSGVYKAETGNGKHDGVDDEYCITGFDKVNGVSDSNADGDSYSLSDRCNGALGEADDADSMRATWRLAGTLNPATPDNTVGESGEQAGQMRAAALLELNGTQQLVFVGEPFADCVLSEVTAKEARFECPDARLMLALNGEPVDVAGNTPNDNLSDSSRDAATVELVRQVAVHRQEFRRAIADRQALVASVNLEPVINDSGLVAYRLLALDTESLFARLGFQAGDLLRAINGAGIADSAASMQVLNNLNDASQLRLALERDGQLLQIEVLLQ